MTSATVHMYWRSRPLTGAEFLALIDRYAAFLAATFPRLTSLSVLCGERMLRVSPNMSNFHALAIEGLPKEWAYTNTDSTDPSFSLGCTSAMGFPIGLRLEGDAGGDCVECDLLVGKSNPNSSNYALTSIGGEGQDSCALVNFMNASIDFWTPRYANANRPEFGDKLGQMPRELQLGWLTYSIQPFPEEIRLDEQVSRVGPGFLLRLGKELPLAGDESFVGRLNQIRDQLRSASALEMNWNA